MSFRFLFLLLSAASLGFAQGLEVQIRTERTLEMGELRYLELRFASQRFTLVPPAGLRQSLDGPEGRLLFSGGTNGISLGVLFLTNNAASVLSSTANARQLLVPYLADGELKEEGEAFGGNLSGRGFTLAHSVAGQPARCRVAALPIPGGCVAFIASGPATQGVELHRLLSGTLTSFQRLAPSTSR